MIEIGPNLAGLIQNVLAGAAFTGVVVLILVGFYKVVRTWY